MGGGGIGDDSNRTRTVVLVGRTGNGKSATANSILGKLVFKSKASSSSVTIASDLKTSVLNNGQNINVIDTPGLFDFSGGSESVGKEIVKCVELAKDGIDAILVVFSVRGRFSEEEETSLRTLQTLFGREIFDYMIVIFTGGDDLEDTEETLEDYLAQFPEPLKDVLCLCENRAVLFDNKTEDEKKRDDQVRKLLSLVGNVITKNDEKPYNDEIFSVVKKEATKPRDQQEEIKRICEMIESRLRLAIARLELQLAEEQAARRKAEEDARNRQRESDEKIRNLQKELEEARKRAAKWCAIM